MRVLIILMLFIFIGCTKNTVVYNYYEQPKEDDIWVYPEPQWHFEPPIYKWQDPYYWGWPNTDTDNYIILDTAWGVISDSLFIYSDTMHIILSDTLIIL